MVGFLREEVATPSPISAPPWPPKLLLETGGRDRTATYKPHAPGRGNAVGGNAGDGTAGQGMGPGDRGSQASTVVRFQYVVRPGDVSADLGYVHENALTLRGGSIRGEAASADADLRVPVPGAEGSLRASSAVVVASR